MASYLICGNPRSGTTLLAGLLHSTGLTGRASEYFGNEEPAWATRDYGRWIQECVARNAGANRMFGAKMMGNDIPAFLGKLRTLPGRAVLADRELLASVFPNLRFVRVTRHDIVAQAVSWWKAAQTFEFYAGDPRWNGTEPVYDFGQIDRLAGELRAADGALADWLHRNGIDAHLVVYEELARDRAGTAQRVLDFLGVEQPRGTRIVERTTKQADAVNAEWIARYRRQLALVEV
jgi:LPS sulfotransferase NodH